jgi:hypothetical protein
MSHQLLNTSNIAGGGLHTSKDMRADVLMRSRELTVKVCGKVLPLPIKR